MSGETKRAAAAAARSRVRTRKVRDRGAPQRPLSAYMIFAQENRLRVREAHPAMKFGEIGKQLGIEWQRLSLAEKKPYEEKASKDKERYERQMDAYKKSKDSGQEDEDVE
ncbi:hypothetical protein AB0A70_17065 [Streptomyces morookaense]|uniref:hypothetical protein n=1 Tax=Streptomyces morookaense TaxID=1970 RepID=UPI00340712EA